MTEPVFVAREREIAELNSFLDKALAGQGQVVFVTGEAGAGKSTLVAEFARRAQEAQPDLLVAIGNCNAQTGIGDPYLPFREVLGLLTGDVETKLAQGAITLENADRLRAFLVRSGRVLVDVAPDLVDVLVPGSRLIALVGTTAAKKFGWVDELDRLLQRKQARPALAESTLEQNRLFEQYTRMLTTLAAEQPLMVVLDDLQWADAASIGLLFHLGRAVRDSRILILGAYRPDDVALGRGGERHPLEPVVNELMRYFGDIWVDLGQTAEAEGRQFVDALLDTEPNRLDEAFRESLFRHTQGHALFTTELLRELQERGDLVTDETGHWIVGSALDWEALPARVEGVIAERIGRLAAELREVLTVASVQGEDFTAEVVARVQAVDERGLIRRLSGELDKQHRLVDAQGLQRVGQQRLSLYRFRHNLFQRYLYNGLDAAERSYLHEDVGNVLEALYGERSDEIAVALARHFQEAGIAEKAVGYLQRAGEQAMHKYANEEAVSLFRQALQSLNLLPPTHDRSERELGLQIALSQSLRLLRGWGIPELKETYDRAYALCQELGETPRRFPVLFGLWSYYLVRSELQTAWTLAEQLLTLAQPLGDPVFLVVAHWAMAATAFWRGDLLTGLDHSEQGLTLYDPQHHARFLSLSPENPGLTCQSLKAIALAMLGYPEQALHSVTEALAMARQLDHPHSMAWVQYWSIWVHQIRGDIPAAQAAANDVLTLATEHELVLWQAIATVARGWARAEQDPITEHLTDISKGLEMCRGAGFTLETAHQLPMLGRAYALAGQTREALGVLDEALELARDTGAHVWEGEIRRLKGDCLVSLSSEHEAEAEACFRQALDINRQQQAKSLELRAAMSLSRLWRQHGKREEARQMLAETYSWFTEGLDTPDLMAAQELLEELSS